MVTFALKVGLIASMFLALMPNAQGLLEEPGCNRFQFQEKMLEKMVVLDHTMKTTLSDLETKLTKYESENAKLKDNLVLWQTKLKTEVEKSNKAMVEERNKMRANYKQATSAQSVQQEQLLFDFGEMRSNISDKINILVEEMKTVTGGIVAHEPVVFIAYLSGGDRNPTVGQPIVFNQEVQNYAHAYNTADGKFTPPIAGVYHFSAQLCMNLKDRVSVQIVSSSHIFAVAAFQEKDYDVTCYSVSTAAMLEKEEKVWVKCVESADHDSGRALEGDGPDRYRTMFSGALIHTV